MSRKRNLAGTYTIPSSLQDDILHEMKQTDLNDIQDSLASRKYQRQKLDIDLTSDKVLTYKEKMERRDLEREEKRRELENKDNQQQEEHNNVRQIIPRKRKKRWDVTPEEWAKQNIHTKTLANLESLPVINGIPLTNEVLDKILPKGYRILPPPPDYTPYDSTLAPDKSEMAPSFYVPPSAETVGQLAAPQTDINGVAIREEDYKYFQKLVKINPDKDNLSGEEKKELQVMELLLKIKNGSPVVRKKSLRKLTSNSKSFGAKVLFNQILPLLLEPSLDVQERHVLVKLIGRVLFQLDSSIRPYTNKILVVISPLLIDENFNMRLEAREIISSLTKAAGLSSMISNLRPDLDHVDEYVRNVTSRVLAIVANTLGLVNFLPFLKAVIRSKKNWMARQTGIKVVQQLCILLGSGNGNSILPYLPQLVDTLQPALSDEALQVRTMTANTLAQLAESVKPFGIDAFEPILEPSWIGLKKHRGKGLASFLRCIGSMVPLMMNDNNYEAYTNYYTKELMSVIAREFNSPDIDMNKAVLKVMVELPLSKTLFRDYSSEIIEPFLKCFWNRRTASDSRQLGKLVIDATSKLATQFEFLDVLELIVIYSKDENENLRRMSLEAINKMLLSGKDNLIGLDSQLETRLIDGILFAFQEQTIPSKVYLSAFGTIVSTLGIRVRPHINSIISTILYRLKNKSPEIRQQSSDLIVKIAPIIKVCSENDDDLLLKLILILYESLGEVYPEVLGSILGALYACIDSVDKMTLYTMQNPSINQLLPTLTPILKNRQEKVQETCVKLVGLIAEKNSETINAKEWMRICFELLDMLKSTKKRIRVAANETFGFIAKTIGPQDVLAMLLNNLRVQERQLRVCTAVAIGIVAENCAPFTVLPALMNEYRIPEKNVQNGVLKALSFLFEYIRGDMTVDYLYAITPLLENALTDRDQVHRQTAATVIKHMALNVVGLTNDYYDVFVHYLNLLLPNIFETSPHVINRILESIDALRIVLGNGSFSNYIWAGLFHPARKVRNAYWKVFNNAYLHHADALVPYYPRIEELPDDDCRYSVDELDIFL